MEVSKNDAVSATLAFNRNSSEQTLASCLPPLLSSLPNLKPPKVKGNAKSKPNFCLDCCDKSSEMLPQYDDLNDKHLVSYFTRPNIQQHLSKLKIVIFLL